jgi:lipoyl(octanoyl) transferase
MTSGIELKKGPNGSWIVLPKFISYPASLQLMQQKVQEVIADNKKIFVLLLEYDDVYTLGSSATKDDLLSISHIPYYQSDRGGQVTYHGPGQRVIYPIIHLSYFDKDIKKYINFLQTTLISTFKELGLTTFFCPEKIGIWVHHDGGQQKIASIGVKVKKWVACHGVSVNIATNLANFDNIVACGLRGYQQTSLEKLGININFEEFDQLFYTQFYKNFP